MSTVEQAEQRTHPAAPAAEPASVAAPAQAKRAKGAAAEPETPPGLTTKQRLSRLLAVLSGRFATTVPLIFGYWLVDRLGDLFYRVSPGYRGSVIDNLRHVLGPDADLDLLRHQARQAFRFSARNFYDLTRLPYLSQDDIVRNVTLIGTWAEVEEAMARGKGVIFITAHMGAFDFAGQLIPYHGYRAVLMTARTVSEFVHEAVTYLRASKGFGII